MLLVVTLFLYIAEFLWLIFGIFATIFTYKNGFIFQAVFIQFWHHESLKEWLGEHFLLSLLFFFFQIVKDREFLFLKISFLSLLKPRYSAYLWIYFCLFFYFLTSFISYRLIQILYFFSLLVIYIFWKIIHFISYLEFVGIRFFIVFFIFKISYFCSYMLHYYF